MNHAAAQASPKASAASDLPFRLFGFALVIFGVLFGFGLIRRYVGGGDRTGWFT